MTTACLSPEKATQKLCNDPDIVVSSIQALGSEDYNNVARSSSSSTTTLGSNYCYDQSVIFHLMDANQELLGVVHGYSIDFYSLSFHHFPYIGQITCHNNDNDRSSSSSNSGSNEMISTFSFTPSDADYNICVATASGHLYFYTIACDRESMKLDYYQRITYPVFLHSDSLIQAIIPSWNDNDKLLVFSSNVLSRVYNSTDVQNFQMAEKQPIALQDISVSSNSNYVALLGNNACGLYLVQFKEEIINNTSTRKNKMLPMPVEYSLVDQSRHPVKISSMKWCIDDKLILLKANGMLEMYDVMVNTTTTMLCGSSSKKKTTHCRLECILEIPFTTKRPKSTRILSYSDSELVILATGTTSGLASPINPIEKKLTKQQGLQQYELHRIKLPLNIKNDVDEKNSSIIVDSLEAIGRTIGRIVLGAFVLPRNALLSPDWVSKLRRKDDKGDIVLIQTYEGLEVFSSSFKRGGHDDTSLALQILVPNEMVEENKTASDGPCTVEEPEMETLLPASDTDDGGTLESVLQQKLLVSSEEKYKLPKRRSFDVSTDGGDGNKAMISRECYDEKILKLQERLESLTTDVEDIKESFNLFTKDVLGQMELLRLQLQSFNFRK